MRLNFLLASALLCHLFVACGNQPQVEESLPYLGESVAVDGRQAHYRIPPFMLINQRGDTISNERLAGRPYVAAFFFTSCPTI